MIFVTIVVDDFRLSEPHVRSLAISIGSSLVLVCLRCAKKPIRESKFISLWFILVFQEHSRDHEPSGLGQAHLILNFSLPLSKLPLAHFNEHLLSPVDLWIAHLLSILESVNLSVSGSQVMQSDKWGEFQSYVPSLCFSQRNLRRP